MNQIIRFLILGVCIYGISMLFNGITVSSYLNAVLVAVVIALVNATIKPVLQFISLPITVLTLGLFYVVVNALLILLVDWFIPGFEVHGFWWAVLFSFALSFVNLFIPGDSPTQQSPQSVNRETGFKPFIDYKNNVEETIDISYEIVDEDDEEK